MPKVTVSQIKNLGFVAAMFRKTDEEFTTFIDAIIIDQSAVLSARIGTTIYASVTAPIPEYIARIELCFVAAEMLQRRINVKIAAVTGSRDNNYNRESPYFEERARAAYLSEAEGLLAKVESLANADLATYSGAVLVTSSTAIASTTPGAEG